MAIRKQRQGSGFTEREVPAFVGSMADMKETLEFAASQATFEAWIAEVETQAQNVLRTGDPQSLMEDSPAHFAGRMLRLIQLTRGAIKRKDAPQAAYRALLLGHLVCQADLKFEWEKAAVGVRVGSSKGGATTALMTKGSTLRIDREIFNKANFELDRRKALKSEGANLTAVLKSMMRKYPKLNSINGMRKAHERGRIDAEST